MVTLPNILNDISDLLLRLILLGHHYCAPPLDPGKYVSAPGSLHLQILHLSALLAVCFRKGQSLGICAFSWKRPLGLASILIYLQTLVLFCSEHFLRLGTEFFPFPSLPFPPLPFMSFQLSPLPVPNLLGLVILVVLHVTWPTSVPVGILSLPHWAAVVCCRAVSSP